MADQIAKAHPRHVPTTEIGAEGPNTIPTTEPAPPATPPPDPADNPTFESVFGPEPPPDPCPNKTLWAKEHVVAIVQGASLNQIMWSGPSIEKATAYMLKYGEGKGWGFRAAFVNPGKKSHSVLGPHLPVNEAGKPDTSTVTDEEWAAADLSAFKAPLPTATSQVGPRAPAAPRAPRAPRTPAEPKEPRLTGVAPLAMIMENASLYPFLRLAENQLLFVHNPNRTRSIRWDFPLTAENIASYKEKTGLDFPLESLEKAISEAPGGLVVVKTRFSRYDLAIERLEGGAAALHVEKYKSDTAVPPPVVDLAARNAKIAAGTAAKAAELAAAAHAAAMAAAAAEPGSSGQAPLSEVIAASNEILAADGPSGPSSASDSPAGES